MQVNYTFVYASKTSADDLVLMLDWSQVASVALLELSLRYLLFTKALLPQGGAFFSVA